MSVENLKEYAHRCAAEPELRAKAKAIGVADLDEHMRHAGSLGLDWTMDDMSAFRKEVLDADGDELADLSEEELEQIAGGVVAAVVAVSVGLVAGVAAGVGVGAVAGGVAAGAATAAGGGGW